MEQYDITVIGGGPAGLAASKSANDNGAKVLLIEREAKLGGILKQCIHDGFGVTRFKEKLSGPEYANREIDKLDGSNVTVSLLTFVSKVTKEKNGFDLTLVSPTGLRHVFSKKLILATGCRERTSKQVMIQGTNPTGVMTAGQAQYYINILGKMPVKNCVILGSGDIGLIMARRITLEGGHVIGVYEVKSTPSGLQRNISQCLIDFNIPLQLSTTVTRVFGVDRLEAVEIAKVDEKMQVIKGTEEIIKCDSLILSVGLIPENELAKSIGVPLSRFTKGPIVDQTFMTQIENVYTCGNAMHVNDLADYVSESGEISGKAACKDELVEPEKYDVIIDSHFGYVVPEIVDFKKATNDMIFYFRSRDVYKNKVVKIFAGNEMVFNRFYQVLRPPEMQRIVVTINKPGPIKLVLEDK